MKKRILSLLITLALCLSLLPTMAWAEEHVHSYTNGLCECGAHDGNHTGWTNWGDEASEWTSLPNSTGNYYLTHDVTLSSTRQLANANVTLCLNGYMVKGTGNDRVIEMIGSTSLNLCDCNSTNQTHYFTYQDDAAWVLREDVPEGSVKLSEFDRDTAKSGETVIAIDGGCITGGKTSTQSGAGVYVSGTFTMNGGTIVGNCTTYVSGGGGAVCVFRGSTFTMNGGAIVGNEAYSGGGVYNDGTTGFPTSTFTMNGGVIVGNKAQHYGGGIYAKNPFKFTMIDGEIRDNGATAGAGMYVSSGTTFDLRGGKISSNTTAGDNGGGVCLGGTMTMSGGEISGNSATGNGGGVRVTSSGTFTMSGGKISNNTATDGGGVDASGTVTLGGAAEITNNTKSDKIIENNLYLRKDKTVAFCSGDDAPTTDMKVGVSMETIGRFSPNGASALKDCFTPDDELNTLVALDGTENYLKLVPNGSAITNQSPQAEKETNHGYIVTNRVASPQNETITLQVRPNLRYRLQADSLKVNGGAVELEQDAKDTSKYTFKMPATAVTVTAVFEENTDHVHKDEDKDFVCDDESCLADFYIKRTWDSTNHTVTETVEAVPVDAIYLTGTTNTATTLENGKTYVADPKNGTIKYSGKVTVASGSTVNLILKDGCDMQITNGGLFPGGTLNVFAQAENSGKLNIKGGYANKSIDSWTGELKIGGGTISTGPNMACDIDVVIGTLHLLGGTMNINNNQQGDVKGLNAGGDVIVAGNAKMTISQGTSAEKAYQAKLTVADNAVCTINGYANINSYFYIYDEAVCNVNGNAHIESPQTPYSVDNATASGKDYTRVDTTKPIVITSGPMISIGKVKDGDADIADPVYGTAQTKKAFFNVEALGFDATPTLELQWKSGSSWSETAPTGITASFSDGVISVGTTATLNAGDYLFRITNGEPETINDPTEGAPNPDFVSTEGTLTVEKCATLPNGTPQSKTIKGRTNRDGQAGTINTTLLGLSSLTGAAIKSFGTETDESSIVTIDTGAKTYTFANTATKATATLELTVSSTNYADFTYTLTFETVDKTPVTVTGATMNKESYTYDGNAVGCVDTSIKAVTDESQDVTSDISSWIHTYYEKTGSQETP